jgi:hypothetical protein
VGKRQPSLSGAILAGGCLFEFYDYDDLGFSVQFLTVNDPAKVRDITFYSIIP